MATEKSRVTGAADIEFVMKRLPAKMSEKALVAALRAGGTVIAREARRLAPKRTGRLKKSIVVKTVRKAERAKRGAIVVIGVKRPGLRYAHLVEFGTKRAAARPYMRPALDSKAREAAARVKEKLAEALAREAEKLAGKFSQSGLRARRRRRR